MSSISEFMTEKHRECDDVFAQAEAAVSKENWPEATTLWQTFVNELETHLQSEEEILFPKFEAATGMTSGPTAVMRMEHGQMRSLVTQISASLNEKNKSEYLSAAETLMVLMQQHNMKEEMMLYPMSEQHIPDANAVTPELANYTLE